MNLVICGDFEHFGLEISNPEETLVSSIIERVATTLDIPSVEISLYFNDKLLQPASPLSPQCGTQCAALLVVVTPLIITIQRYDTNVSFNVEISRLTAPRWETDALFDFCLYKAGMPRRKNGKYVFIVQGTVLKEGKTISDYKFLNNNFTISIMFLQTMLIKDPITFAQDTSNPRSVLIPTGCSDDKVLSSQQTSPKNFKWSNNTTTTLQLGKRQIYDRWKLTIQTIDGTKKIVELKNNFVTPVYELRSKVSSIDKIRLTISETVLEDFNEEGHIMLLCSYPQLHDGATLYQINLFDAISVNCRYQNVPVHNKVNYTKAKLDVPAHLDENVAIGYPPLIHIENPNKFTVQRFIRATENFGRLARVQTNDGQNMSRQELSNPSIPSSDAVVGKRFQSVLILILT